MKSRRDSGRCPERTNGHRKRAAPEIVHRGPANGAPVVHPCRNDPSLERPAVITVPPPTRNPDPWQRATGFGGVPRIHHAGGTEFARMVSQCPRSSQAIGGTVEDPPGSAHRRGATHLTCLPTAFGSCACDAGASPGPALPLGYCGLVDTLSSS